MSAHLHPFSYASQAEEDFINIVSAEGSTLTDSNGKTYLDGMASLWYCQVGHGRQEIIGAITSQLNTLDAYNTFAPFTNAAAGEVCDLIAAKSPHPDGRVFLGSSGSEAADTSMKIARLIQQRRGHPEKQIIVRRTLGYHGTNFGGTTAQGLAPNREGWGDLVPHFIEVPSNDTEAMATVFADHGAKIAAVISEPVQGAGGVQIPADGYLEASRRLCDQHGALLIFDEVICGFGRTGSWFGAQTYGVTPDMLNFAKGVTSGYQPLSGVILSAELGAELSEDGFMLRHGYTYSGHPAACAAGVANINLIESEGLIERANHIGKKLKEGFDALQGDGMIESSRGVGALWAAELGKDSLSYRDDLLHNHGVIMRPIGTSLALCPPLIITDDEIGHVIESMAAVLA